MILQSDAIQVRVDPPIATITLNRPDAGNALTRAMVSELQVALGDVHAEKRIRAVVLAARGDSFCVGRDVAEIAPSEDTLADMVRWGDEAREYQELLVAMLQLPKPLIAAVQGPALAAGAGLVLACDAAIGSDAALFGFPEPRQGIVAGVAAPLLAFCVGGAVASRLLVLADTIDAAEAHRLGLYHKVTPTDLTWAQACDWARTAAESAPQAVGLTKRLLYDTVAEQLMSQLSSGAAASATAMTTDSAREGLAAHLENRQPEWP
ncbi:enoyl-CoA hydratase/isomerase family protein [Botrimarina hoheduenensis]|uniref:Putative enoyl-CoA hydratase echA8 n=1 Tax=Botrimarina hoheduenensis TaxID=2528000 RepID=A0A5C5VXR6_9BACT|nr:enoyl-CoA hydratase/isomerase family protein [Botrimarina hoheduenensis]TWT42703.1 putative enoyl-CoA hydratase echA8 [Botrimarina hoheduenensis]